jgi:hypothetical protein
MVTRSGIQKLALVCLLAGATWSLTAQASSADDARLTIKPAVLRTEAAGDNGVKTELVRWYGYGPYRARYWGPPVWGYPAPAYYGPVGVGVGIAPAYVAPAPVVPVYGPAYGYPVYGYPAYGYRYGW